MPFGLCQAGYVAQRIAIDDDQIGIESLPHPADAVGHAEKLRGIQGRLAHQIGGLNDLASDREFLRLPPVHLAQQVRAISDMHTAAISLLQRHQSGVEDVPGLLHQIGGQARGFALLHQ